MKRGLGLALVVALGALAVPARAEDAVDLRRPFEPTPISQPLYDINPPDAAPGRQRHVVKADDGTELFV